jgi:hypothetical protein
LSYSNPIAALSGALSLPSIHSPDYATSGGATGWSINRDGTATFNTTGGSFQITANGLFFYVPAAGSGTLIASFANTAGVDQYGNQYDAGFFLNQKQAHLTGDQSDTIMINPNGALGPEILFAEAGFNFASHIIQFGNELRVEEANASGADFLINMPFRATGGLSAIHTAAGAQPPFGSTGAYVAYLSASWTPVDIVCPPSETIRVDITIQGHNVNSVNSNVSVQPRVNDQTNGAALLFTPSTATAAGPTVTSRSTTDTTDLQSSCTYTFGKDILGGLAGHTIRFTPMWRISSGGAGTASVGYGSMVATPCVFEQLTSG